MFSLRRHPRKSHDPPFLLMDIGWRISRTKLEDADCTCGYGTFQVRARSIRSSMEASHSGRQMGPNSSITRFGRADFESKDHNGAELWFQRLRLHNTRRGRECKLDTIPTQRRHHSGRQTFRPDPSRDHTNPGCAELAGGAETARSCEVA
jgi:hypothetical protein